MTSRTMFGFAALLTATSLTGCYEECGWDDEYCEDYGYEYDDWSDGGSWYDDDDWTLDDDGDRDGGVTSLPDGPGASDLGPASECTFVGTEMSGALGDVGRFSGNLYLENAWVSAEETVVALHAADCASDWNVMLQLTLKGDIAGDAWAPGTTHTLADVTNPTCPCAGGGAEGTGDVEVLGCSSTVGLSCTADPDLWTYDDFASEVTVTVVEGATPGSRRFVFEAGFGTDGTVSGAFELDCACEEPPLRQ